MDGTGRRSGGDLFIVDNSLSRWTGLEYLREWTDLARSFDVATGFFEISSLLALDGKWQQLEKIRILMGDQVSLRPRGPSPMLFIAGSGALTPTGLGISCPQVRRRRQRRAPASPCPGRRDDRRAYVPSLVAWW